MNTKVRCDLFVEKSTKKYISKLKKYISILKKNKYLIPAITMIICLSITIGITLVVKSVTQINKEEVSIATNSAEAAFYNKKYDAAIAGYTKLQEEEEWPIWKVKIAEIYSVKGDFIKSNEIVQEVYEIRNKIIDTKKEEIDTLEIKDIELENYIVFTNLRNGEENKALEFG